MSELSSSSAISAGKRSSDLRDIVRLAAVLQTLEASDRPGQPDQYRAVSVQLSGLLAQSEGGDALRAVLARFPAAAELYENVRYEQAGLCLRPLAVSADTECLTRGLLERLAQASRAG